LLINPPQQKPIAIGVEDDFIDIIGYYPPLGLLYLATCLKNAGHLVKVVDCVPMQIGYPELSEIITEFDPFLVGVTTYTTGMWDVLTTINQVKQCSSEIFTLLGGHHVNLYPSESIKYNNVDFILQGEAENTIVQLVQMLSRNANAEELLSIDGIGFFRNNIPYLNSKPAYIANLDSLPIPDRSFLPAHIYKSVIGRNNMLATIMSSRGCPFRCTFCYTPNKQYRSRTNENIIAEIKYLIQFGFKELFFFDDLFALKAEKVISFSNMLLQENIQIEWSFRARVNTISNDLINEIKKSGVHRIQFGLESGVDATLKRIKKDTNTQLIRDAIRICRKNGVQTVGSFIIGLPYESQKDIEETIRFSKNIGLNYAQFNIFMPYPFTEAYLDGLKNNAFTHDYWQAFAENPLEKAESFQMEYWTTEVSKEYLFKTVKKAFHSFYLRPSVIWSKFWTLKSWQEFKFAVSGALSVIKFNPKGKKEN